MMLETKKPAAQMSLSDYEMATDRAIFKQAGYGLLTDEEIQTAVGGIRSHGAVNHGDDGLDKLRAIDKQPGEMFIPTDQATMEYAKRAGQAVLQYQEYQAKQSDAHQEADQSKTNQMLLDPLRLGGNVPFRSAERILNTPRDILQQIDRGEILPGSSTAKWIGGKISEQITGEPAPKIPTLSESVEQLTGAKLPSIPEIEVPRPFEYQTEKYKREGKIGEDLGATAIDLFLLKREIVGKSEASPQSLKTLGGLPEVKAAAQTTQATAQTAATTEVAEVHIKPVWKAAPSETVPSAKRPIGALGNPEKVPSNPKTIAEKIFTRSIQKQNEAAGVMSKNGYLVEYQPKITAQVRMSRFPWLKEGKKPDFKIEGEIFDALSPDKNTRISNIIKRITDKTVKGQARRILLNLDDSKVSISELAKELRLSKLQFLDEVIVVKNGKITKIYPYNQTK